MRSINDFCEPLDHEFDELNLVLKAHGAKLDGEDGLKLYCKLNKFKSVDYLFSGKSGYYFLEFSDIAKQKDDLILRADLIKKIKDLPSKEKRRLVKSFHKTINEEVVSKYKDTCHIFIHAKQHVCNVPETVDTGCHLFIVFSPLDDRFADNKTEIIRFLDNMKDKITQAIPDPIFKQVSVLSIDQFERLINQ